jgi:hypothetical protein
VNEEKIESKTNNASHVIWSLVTTDSSDQEVLTSPCRLTYLRHLPDAEEVLVECKMSDTLVGSLKAQCSYIDNDHKTVTAQVFTLTVTLSCQSIVDSK